MEKIKNNECPSVCTECAKTGQTCCSRYGGAFHPDQLHQPITIESLTDFINRGDVAIDWYENFDDDHEHGYLLRMKHRNVENVVDPSWGAACVHLKDNGCELSFEERAYGCQRLTPKSVLSNSCDNAYEKYEAAKDWLPYYDIIEKWINDNGGMSNITDADMFGSMIELLKSMYES